MKTEQSPAAASHTEAEPPEARPSIRFTTNTILHIGGFQGSAFFAAGSETPFHSIDEVPESLRGFVAPAEPVETAESDERFANFQLNTVYLSNSDGSRGRALRRQVGELAGAAAEQERAEFEAIAANELDPETEKILQEKHDSAIAYETKVLEVAQARRDDEEEAARLEALRAQEPAKPAERFVKRGSVYRAASAVKLRVGEQVFTRQPNGQWWLVGLVDANGNPPDQEITL
jgi:hypothetical protein